MWTLTVPSCPGSTCSGPVVPPAPAAADRNPAVAGRILAEADHNPAPADHSPVADILAEEHRTPARHSQTVDRTGARTHTPVVADHSQPAAFRAASADNPSVPE